MKNIEEMTYGEIRQYLQNNCSTLDNFYMHCIACGRYVHVTEIGDIIAEACNDCEPESALFDEESNEDYEEELL